jgi:hypothetical protein
MVWGSSPARTVVDGGGGTLVVDVDGAVEDGATVRFTWVLK